MLVGACQPAADPSELLLTNIAPTFLTLDKTAIYWSEAPNPGGGPLKRVKKDKIQDADVEALGLGFDPLAIDGMLYSTTEPDSKTLTLNRYQAPGDVEPMATFQGSNSFLAADHQNIYLTTFDSDTSVSQIWVQPLDGTPASLVVTDADTEASFVAAGDGEVFWISHLSRSKAPAPESMRTAIKKVGFTGGVPATLFESPDYIFPRFLVNSDSLFFVVWNRAPRLGTLFKIDRHSGAMISLAEVSDVSDLALDSDNLYWVESDLRAEPRGMIRRLPLQGGSPITILSTKVGPNTIAVDDMYIYWGTAGDVRTPDHEAGTLSRLLKKVALGL